MSKALFAGVLLGLLGLSASLLSAPIPDPHDGRSPAQVEADRALLNRIVKQAADPKVQFEQLAPLWQQMQRQASGTPEWRQAAEIVRQVPSLLDRLQREQIPELDRLGKLPREVVAVLGENRSRHWREITRLAGSPDGRFLISQSWGHLCIWDLATLRERSLPSATGVGTLAWAPKGAVLAVVINKEVQIWDVAVDPIRVLKRLKGYTEPVRSLVLLADGKTLVTSAREKVIFWDISGEEPRQVRRVAKEGREDSLYETLSPNGRFVIDENGRKHCLLWCLAENAERKMLELEGSWQYFNFSPDGKKLATHTFGQEQYQVWDLAGAKPKLERTIDYAYREGREFQPVFSPDGEILAHVSGSDRFEFFPLTAAKRRQLGVQLGQTSREYVVSTAISAVKFLPDGKTVVLRDGGGRCFRLFDLETGKERFQPQGHRSAITASALALDGRTLATGDEDGDIHLWDLASQPPEKAILKRSLFGGKANIPSWVYGLAFSPDQQFLLSVQKGTPLDGTVQVWDLRQMPPGKPKIMQVGSTGVGTCLFSPDGKTVATLGSDERVLDPTMPNHTTFLPAAQLWDWMDGTLTLRQRLALKSSNPNFNGGAWSRQFSPDGKLLAIQLGREEIQVWDVQRTPPQQVGSITQEDMTPPEVRLIKVGLQAFTFSADGRQLLTANYEGNIEARTNRKIFRWWDLGGKKPVQRKSWVDKDYYDVRMALSPNGRQLAMIDEYYYLSILDLDSGRA